MVKRVVGAIAAFGAVVSLAMNAPAVAQPIDVPYLVRDIADDPSYAQQSSYLMFESAVGGRANFWAASDSAGSRWTLWSTDGTPAATHLETAFDISVGEPAVAVGDDLLVFPGGNGDGR